MSLLGNPAIAQIVQAQSGTAAAPSIGFGGDNQLSSGNGLFLKSAGVIGVAINGTEVLNYSSTGQSNAGNVSGVNGVLSGNLQTQRANVASAATIASLSSTTSFVKLTGSTATDLQGIAAGADGQNLRLWNATGANLTIRNASASAASGEKITTCTGADIVTTGNGFAEFIYDTDASPAVWVCSYVSA